MPAVPGRILADCLGYRRGDEAVIEFRTLARVVPGRAVRGGLAIASGRMVGAIVVDEVGRVRGK